MFVYKMKVWWRVYFPKDPMPCEEIHTEKIRQLAKVCLENLIENVLKEKLWNIYLSQPFYILIIRADIK